MSKQITAYQQLWKKIEKDQEKLAKLRKSALRWANDYMFKHGIEMPECQHPRCEKQANQKHILVPNKANRKYVYFFCDNHIRQIIKGTKPGLTDEEQDKLSTEEQLELKEQRTKEELVKELPDPYDITDLKKTKLNGKTKTALRREIRTILRTSLSHLDQSHCENIDCKSTNLLQDISYYLRPDGSDYNVSFLCRSCKGKVNYDKTILKKTPSYELMELVKQNEDKSDEELYSKSFKEGNQFLIERLKAECSARNIFPENTCTMCGAEIPEQELLSPKIDVVFPKASSHMYVAFFCEECQIMSDRGDSYDTFFEYGYQPQNLTDFAPPNSCIRTHFNEVEKIQYEITPVGKV